MDSLAYMLASGGDDDSLKLWFWLIVLKTLFAVRRFENGDDGNSKAGPHTKDDRLN